VRIDSASVGQGFWSDNGQLQGEHDLDLVVTGDRDSILAMGAILGRSWDQSAVYVWFPAGGGETQATATIPLPGGADALTDAVYQSLITELGDGGHVRYAGPQSLIFVAKTGDDSDTDFYARMERVRALLAAAGITAGEVQAGQAEFLSLDRDNYESYIQPRVQGKAA
jgi:hypothetical protein